MHSKPKPHRRALPLLLLLLSAQLACAYYDPGLQRWINRDPKDETGFYRVWRNDARRAQPATGPSASRVNLFTYVSNGPVNAVDPDGRQAGWIARCLRLSETSAGHGVPYSCLLARQWVADPGPGREGPRARICIYICTGGGGTDEAAQYQIRRGIVVVGPDDPCPDPKQLFGMGTWPIIGLTKR